MVPGAVLPDLIFLTGVTLYFSTHPDVSKCCHIFKVLIVNNLGATKNAGFSWLIMPYLSIGANLGYASSTLAEGHSYGAFNADVMAMVKFGGFKASVGVRNLGTSVKSSSGDSFQLPSSVAAGVGYKLAAGDKLALDFNVDADYYFKDGVAVAGGVSCTIVEMATVRAGYRYGGNTVLPSYASVGAGLCLFGARIDLAYLIAGKDSPFANTLCVGAGFSF